MSSNPPTTADSIDRYLWARSNVDARQSCGQSYGSAPSPPKWLCSETFVYSSFVALIHGTSSQTHSRQQRILLWITSVHSAQSSFECAPSLSSCTFDSGPQLAGDCLDQPAAFHKEQIIRSKTYGLGRMPKCSRTSFLVRDSAQKLRVVSNRYACSPA